MVMAKTKRVPSTSLTRTNTACDTRVPKTVGRLQSESVEKSWAMFGRSEGGSRSFAGARDHRECKAERSSIPALVTSRGVVELTPRSIPIRKVLKILPLLLPARCPRLRPYCVGKERQSLAHLHQFHMVRKSQWLQRIHYLRFPKPH